MITTQSLRDFIEETYEAQQKDLKEIYELSVSERVKQRKAINGVYVVPNSSISDNEEGGTIFTLRYTHNQSDFKEGESLVISTGNPKERICQCTLTKFLGDNEIKINVSNWDYFPADKYIGTELVLDHGSIDIRNTYYKYVSDGAIEDNLPQHFINTKRNPTFNYNYKPCTDEPESLKEQINWCANQFDLHLTPNQFESVYNALAVNDYYLIQGPPGSGKSFVLAFIAIMEAFLAKKKVVIMGPNHLAINNALQGVARLFPKGINRTIKVGQYYNTQRLSFSLANGEQITITNLSSINVEAVKKEESLVLGMTVFCPYSRRASDIECDTLIIDEAGQMNHLQALMAMHCATKVILCGDHKQLAPIIPEEISDDEMKQSVFERLFNANNGTLLDYSFRMNDQICGLVSDLFYGGKLKPKNPEKRISITMDGEDHWLGKDDCIILKDIKGLGSQVSDEEAREVVNIIEKFYSAGQDLKEIAVLTPFRAQAAHIRRLIKKSTIIPIDKVTEISADTIDRMQGQEREIIIISITAGNPGYVNQLKDFLFNAHKLNVAISRASCKVIILANIEAIKGIDEYDQSEIKRVIDSPRVRII